MGLPAARVNARSGRVCMFVCANVHAPFLSKAPYWDIRIFKNNEPDFTNSFLNGTAIEWLQRG